jgi:hypothetical protein
MTPVSMASVAMCATTGWDLGHPEKSGYREHHNEDYEGEEKWENYR